MRPYEVLQDVNALMAFVVLKFNAEVYNILICCFGNNNVCLKLDLHQSQTFYIILSPWQYLGFAFVMNTCSSDIILSYVFQIPIMVIMLNGIKFSGNFDSSLPTSYLAPHIACVFACMNEMTLWSLLSLMTIASQFPAFQISLFTKD